MGLKNKKFLLTVFSQAGDGILEMGFENPYFPKNGEQFWKMGFEKRKLLLYHILAKI